MTLWEKDAAEMYPDHWEYEGGFLNWIRRSIRRRVTFSTYYYYVAPWLDWPGVRERHK